MPSINDLSDGTHFVTDQTHFAGQAIHPARVIFWPRFGGLENNIVMWKPEKLNIEKN